MIARLVRGLRLPALLTVLVLVLAAGPVPARAEPAAEQIAQSLTYYSDLEFEKGIALAKSVLERDDLTVQDRIAAYAALSLLTYSLGESYARESYGYLDRIAELGPCAISLPEEYWPQELRDRWYGVAKEAGALTCETDGGDKEIRTVAIMEFDNYSMGKYQEKLGFLTKGLAEFFESDFNQLSGLSVVERDKIDYILDEIMLAKKGMVDQATAVEAGKLLGAQVMIFGSVVQMDDDDARMIVKAVNTETSEIIATAERQGKPDFFHMEKELVKELAGSLDVALSGDAEQRIDEAGTGDADAAELYSRGLYHMDRYEYAEAYDYFRKAYAADPGFDEAKHKMDIYRPLAVSS